MKPAAFEYHAPATVEEAAALLAELGDQAKLIAGGQSLVPMLALRLAVFDHLVDVSRTAGLRGVRRESGGALWIGAGTTQAAIERSAEVAEAVPLLARATPLIGHFQIRNRGTLGGSIAHADAAAEYPAVAVTLDAELEAVSAAGARTIPSAKFFLGQWTTELGADEVLTGLRFPVWRGRTGFAVEEFARRHGDFAIAGAAIAVELDPDDRIRRCGIGLFGLGSKPERATAVEAELIGRHLADVAADEVGRAAISGLGPCAADLHGSAEYRARVGAAVVARGWQRALREAGDG
ncbi:xanthine dehydrogenase family protein subunit M [Pseudonocardia eucalypti]|uniref:Xanthine dehydrogenase family protein subunit M n=1 Tax=Pseudonocardia eucalypti TaxID=648755 RepID=A0ABP9PM13_9PSEU|nr:carbon-monoxide dehydrogenase medium subunit [Pseudonocardia eucalypti]